MKLITIKPFNGESYTGFKLPPEVASTQEHRISAQFGPGSADTLRGLSPEEEKKWLPDILGVQPTDNFWREATKYYWADMSIIIPDEGLILNIGMKDDGEPIKLLDYIRYRFICKQSEVAKNQKECVWPTHRFYIVDVEEVKKDQLSDFEVRNKANNAFMHLQQESNYTKAKWVAEVLRKSDEKIVHMNREELFMFLEKKKDESLNNTDTKVIKFADVVKNPNLEQEAMIMEFLGAGILEKNGNSFFYGDAIIGEKKEAIAWFKNQVNSRQILEMKEKLKAYV